MLSGSAREAGVAAARGGRARALLVGVSTLVALAVWLLPGEAHAYAWMIRHGYTGCTTCHADPSGGELLSPYGSAQGDLLVRMRYGKATAKAEPAPSTDFDDFDDDMDAEAAQPAPAATSSAEAEGPSSMAGFLWGAWTPPSALWLGGSIRTLAIYQPGRPFKYFPMQLDAYGSLRVGKLRAAGSIGVVRVPANSPNARRAQVTTAQGDSMNLISRTHWVGWEEGAFYLRAGRLNLPYGVRLSEHTLWARDRSYTDRESDQQHGVALAFNEDQVRGEMMLIAGNFQMNPDKYRERGYSGYVETRVAERAAVGLNSLITRADADFTTIAQDTTVRQAHGVMGRWSPAPPVVLLAEANVLLRSRQDTGYVGFVQADYQVLQGLHLGATGELLDEGYLDQTRAGQSLARAAGNGEPRWGGWLTAQWFFWSHLDFRVDAIWRQPVAQENPFMLLGQLHAYL